MGVDIAEFMVYSKLISKYVSWDNNNCKLIPKRCH